MKGWGIMENIKVLWMNNGEEATIPYVAAALDYHIQIETFKTWAICRDVLSGNSTQNKDRFEAIIVNAHCKTFENQVPNVSNLGNVLKWLNNHCKRLPYYVINTNKTLGKTDSQLLKILLGSKNKYYSLKEPVSELFECIYDEVTNLPHRKYEKQIAICREQERESLLSLLWKLSLDSKDLERDHTIPNECRKVLEGIRNNFNDGVINIPSLFLPIPALDSFSTSIGSVKDGIPEYIKRSFHTCCRVSQDGSHADETDKLIKEGKAPFLTRTLILDLLNILNWLYDINNR